MKHCPICGEEFSGAEVCPKDGAVLVQTQTVTDLLIGQVLKGTYRIEEQIGAGGMGVVFRGTQEPLGRAVAIKVLLPNLQSTPSMIQRFFQEARLLSQLSHPNVVGIIDFGNTETGMVFMVMEYLEGSTLGQVVPVGEGLPLVSVVALTRQICAGVAAAHAQKLVHRDLKPDNIFVSGSGTQQQVKILDFGIARALESSQTRLTHTGLLMGTPGFLAPEQIESAADADARSDVYALGAILFFMLSGQRPYQGLTPHSILARQLHEPPAVDVGVLGANQPLASVVLKAMQRDPRQRYKSADELHTALCEASESCAVEPTAADGVHNATAESRVAPTLLVGGSPAPPKGRFRPVLAVAVVLVGLVVAGLWWFQRGPSGTGSSSTAGGAADGSPASDVRGISAEHVLVGMSAAFSGPSRELGRGMQLGIETCFRDVNRQGGVHGRELQLVALDDGYEPGRAVANMTELLLARGVFAVLGNVGTPTAEVALPLALQHDAPFFGAFTGADLLRRQPPDRLVFNYRAGYREETAAIVGYFLDHLQLQPSQISVFAQDDGFGDAGYRGVRDELERRGHRQSVPRLGYRRNTQDVGGAVEQLLDHHTEVRAVVLVATYRAAAEIIRQLEDRDADLVYASLSFVGSRALAEELRELGPRYAEGVIVTQVVPHFDSSDPGVARYRALLAEHFPAERIGFVSLEGYLAARLFVEALERAGREPTVDGFIAGAESIINLDLGIGSPIHLAADRHQGSHKVWGTVLDGSANYQVLELASR